jgi:hypothetical protein
VKLFENFSLEDLLIKIFVPDSNKKKAVDPFDMVLKKEEVKEVKNNQNKYTNHKKSG